MSSLTLQGLQQKLTEFDIDYSQWNRGEAKSVAHLLKEINTGETQLIDIEGQLVRNITIVLVEVTYQGKILIESKQMFHDGRSRKRGLTQLSEKVALGEDVESASRRAINEELGIKSDVDVRRSSKILDQPEVQVLTSQSFPTLLTRYEKYFYQIELTEDQYNPDGYIEHQDDKDTYFEWQPS